MSGQENTSQQHTFADVSKLIEDADRDGSLRTPVFEVRPVMPRSDNMSIFEEGKQFGGLVENDTAQACVTIVASAHTPATVPKEAFLRAAKEVFGENASLPESTAGVELLPPQTVVWWATKVDSESGNQFSQERSDFLALAKMSEAERKAMIGAAAEQTTKAARFIETLKGSSVIWGSWGNGTLDERQKTGMSRGVPTNAIGHTHVIHMDEAMELLQEQNQEATLRDEINFFGPWTKIVMERFGDELGVVLQECSNQRLRVLGEDPSQEVVISVKRQSQEDPDFGAKAGTYDGYTLSFSQPVSYEVALDSLVEIAGSLEQIYQAIVLAHSEFYRNLSNVDFQDGIREQLRVVLESYGFGGDTAAELVAFALDVKPTRVQLESWRGEGNTQVSRLYDRYLRMAKRLARSGGSLFAELVADTYRPVEQIREIERTFPVHATGWYLFDQYSTDEKNITLSKCTIFPALSSTVGGTERMLGGVQKRPLT